MQFSVSSAAVLQQIQFYSVAGATVLPDVMGLFDTSGNLVVWATPTWSGAAGSGWVHATFTAPVFLAPSFNYVAVIHMPFSSPNWNMTDATYWSSGAGSSGITSGILSAPNNATAVHGQDSSVAGSAIEFPNTSMTGANIWLDVLVADAPANTYTIFKQQPVSAPSTNDNSTYTMGMQWSSSSTPTVNAIWWFSPYFPTQSPELPEEIGIYSVTGQTLIASATPTWSGPAGSGWVRAAFPSPPVLSASTNYKAVILKNGGSNNWYASVSNYWTSGPGASGLSNGPLAAPNNAGGDGGQDTFNSGTGIIYPAGSFNGGNYWVDVEISTSGGPTLISVSDFAGVVESRSGTATLSVQDFAGVLDVVTVLTGTPIFVSDFAGTVESSPAITATVLVFDVAGMVERMAGTVGLSVTDVAAGLDTVLRSSSAGNNLKLPAIVLMAGTYMGAS